MVGNGSTYFTCDYFNAVLLGGIDDYDYSYSLAYDGSHVLLDTFE